MSGDRRDGSATHGATRSALDFYLEVEQVLDAAVLCANHGHDVVSVLLLVDAARRIDALERAKRVAFGPPPAIASN